MSRRGLIHVLLILEAAVSTLLLAQFFCRSKHLLFC